MSKQLYSQRFILKLQSDRLKESDWKLDINLQEAKDNEELIQLGDSQLLRFIREITNNTYSEEDISDIKKNIKVLKKDKNSIDNKRKITELYNKLDNMLYIKDYIAITFSKKSDFDRATNREGFSINGVRFKRLLGTTGGVKANTIMFCSETIHKELNIKLDNGRNKDIPLVPAKFEAYKALCASVSSPVTNTKRILVIKDGVTHIKDKIIKVSDDGDKDYNVEYGIEYEAEKEFTDGGGMIRPSLAEQWAIDLGLYHFDENENKIADYIPSGFNTRYSFEKGMLATFDFELFGEEIAHNHIVTDAWGNKKDIREIDIIFTTNMLKLWDCYDSIEDYISNCDKNGYLLSVTKVCPKELELKRNMNYQYLQSYEFTDKDIYELTYETVNNIKDVLGLDVAKSILFSKGIHIDEKNIKKSEYDFIKALTIDQRVLGDSYIKNKLYGMIEKKIKEAKKGVIQVNGSYAIIIGDMYALCQSMFDMEVTGLLGKGEFYSRTWSDRGCKEIVSYRSPMTSHNNISKKKLIDNDKVKKWFKYINTMTVFNAWDTTTDAMNGCDFDSDAEIETNNKVIMRTTRDELAIVCEQKSTPKENITDVKLRKSNKNGFGNEVGSITNKVTTMYDVLASLEKGSKEYNELMRRIICGQALQQEEIDKIKGIQAKQMPKEWYDYKINKIKDDDTEEIKQTKEMNLKLMVNKKPYFFIYNYDGLHLKYTKFMKKVQNNCLIRFGKTLEELKECEIKSDEEKQFLKSMKYKSPVFTNPSAMNRICWKIEDEFKGVKLKCNKDDINFNKELYKTDKKYSKVIYDKIAELLKEYKTKQRDYFQTNKNILMKEDKIEKRKGFVKNFKEKAEKSCPNSEDLCNIVIDLTYDSKINRQFAWDICKEQIINNLLNKNNNKYTIPIQCENGDIEWCGLRYRMEEIEC